MSLQQLLDSECGGANSLLQFSNQITSDATFKNLGIHRESNTAIASSNVNNECNEQHFINEFLDQSTNHPQTFQMNALLQEMRDIEIPQVNNVDKKDEPWTSEFFRTPSKITNNIEQELSKNKFTQAWTPSSMQNEILHYQPQPKTEIVHVNEFFDANENELQNNNGNLAMATNHTIAPLYLLPPPPQVANYIKPLNIVNDNNQAENMITTEDILKQDNSNATTSSEIWLDDFTKTNFEEARKTEEYNQKFWQNLQDEWKKLSEDSSKDYEWLSKFTDYYDPYKEYTFIENNPMSHEEDVFEKGKFFLEQGDIPNAVLCFESAAKQQPDNPEVWELLGISQAENEMDPQAIAALKKSLKIKPDNMKVLMALAVSYTNESLQSQALKVLLSWLQCNPKYKNLVEKSKFSDLNLTTDFPIETNSLIRAPELKEIQNLFLDAVKQNPNNFDPDIQEALGVLFTLSSEYDKAVDCFKAALQIRPDNAKVWNRLGASLANGNRSVEAVEAYQRALEISPGYIRARYNVGIVCMNLKAYKESAEHLLEALNFQATSVSRSGLKDNILLDSSKRMSDTIWSTLRMVISLMGMWDLQEAIDARNLDALNKIFNVT